MSEGGGPVRGAVEPGPHAGADGAPPRIEPADTSVAAVLGACRGGPANRPVDVRDMTDFDRVYRQGADSSLRRAVHTFFANGGSRALVVRVTRASTALAGLADQDWQLLVVDAGVVDLAEAHALCLRRRAFLVCDASADGVLPSGLGSNAAAYFPPLSTGPCAPAVAGVLARIDARSGVWKAPAGVGAGLVGTLSRQLTAREADELRRRRVNALRTLATGGPVLWGARTASEDPEWQYVSVRRLALFLERSIGAGLPWVAGEPDVESVWATVRTVVGDFLLGLWRLGAIVGTKPEEAYVVRCDRSTMTQADVDAGRVVVLVGVAPLKPAEFVLVRIEATAAAPGAHPPHP